MGITEGQSIFVCGGRDHSWRGSTMGLQYCPARDCWSSAGTQLRDGVTFASVASLGETCFLFGNSLPPLSSIPNSETAWVPLPTAPFTTGLQFAAVEAVSESIVVAGGRSLPNKARLSVTCMRALGFSFVHCLFFNMSWFLQGLTTGKVEKGKQPPTQRSAQALEASKIIRMAQQHHRESLSQWLSH